MQWVAGQKGGMWLQFKVHQWSIPGVLLQIPLAWQEFVLSVVVVVVVVVVLIVVVSNIVVGASVSISVVVSSGADAVIVVLVSFGVGIVVVVVSLKIALKNCQNQPRNYRKIDWLQFKKIRKAMNFFLKWKKL